MIITVYGGAGSGKSKYAEGLAVNYGENLIYIATMQPFGEEAYERIEKHQKQRKKKGFSTIECYTGIQNLDIEKDKTILLECMSNLLANEMFSESKLDCVNEILCGIKHLEKNAANIIIVTNNVFEDGICYDEYTTNYITKLAQINQELMNISDIFIEVVCSIPIFLKGSI